MEGAAGRRGNGGYAPLPPSLGGGRGGMPVGTAIEPWGAAGGRGCIPPGGMIDGGVRVIIGGRPTGFMGMPL